ncbi:hypothetical protein POSPLADRAFT_1058189 [Postia placenta MAD-698-R-SB12]|uniref:Uncharacterized protein n=1 Tax=Postia placenta MAD-698-R-SB12 TaxID=670580 RepID=A0A1X6MY38_9APHY|nr:hypothetical protein POSPLADRAFT_1058189 [Postia placenta MAD-698-R-SB12]OSX61269.1 hypothetical protein POSPLADRAFT_1058189 [Postia placenta MAD-698-R-SB12]
MPSSPPAHPAPSVHPLLLLSRHSGLYGPLRALFQVLHCPPVRSQRLRPPRSEIDSPRDWSSRAPSLPRDVTADLCPRSARR